MNDPVNDHPGPRVPVLFIAGIGRSGTTLLERTLAEAEGITALGEVMHLWQRGLVRRERCGCGEPFHACPFWSQIGERAFGGWGHVDAERIAHLKDRVDRTRRLPRLWLDPSGTFRREVEEYVGHFVRVYRAAHELTGGVVIDSSKQGSLAWLLSTSLDLDLRVVQCVRDSRGVTYSWSKTLARPEAVSPEHAEMPRYSSPQMAAYWTYHNLTAQALARRVPHHRLRYEDFVADPAGATRAVLDLVGVDSPVRGIDGHALHLGVSHSCAGNPMRFRLGDIDVVADEQWRERQAPAQRRLVTTLTAPLLLRYGYLR